MKNDSNVEIVTKLDFPVDADIPREHRAFANAMLRAYRQRREKFRYQGREFVVPVRYYVRIRRNGTHMDMPLEEFRRMVQESNVPSPESSSGEGIS